MDRPQRRTEMRSHCGSWGLPRNNVCQAWCHSQRRWGRLGASGQSGLGAQPVDSVLETESLV